MTLGRAEIHDRRRYLAQGAYRVPISASVATLPTSTSGSIKGDARPAERRAPHASVLIRADAPLAWALGGDGERWFVAVPQNEPVDLQRRDFRLPLDSDA